METLAAHGQSLPELPNNDALDEATVLVAGRGRNYPGLAVAVGERVGLVGALSVESAARALNARDIDGMIIGDGFGPRIIEALLTVLAEDVRFRDLPVAVLGGHPGVVEEFLPHIRRTSIALPAVRRAWSSAFCRLCGCMPSASGSSACSNRSTPRA